MRPCRAAVNEGRDHGPLSRTVRVASFIQLHLDVAILADEADFSAALAVVPAAPCGLGGVVE